MSSAPGPRHVVAIIGGATAGAEAAGILADHGVLSVVFEQNVRPWGKIEDGLPRWHTKLRRKEYDTINDKLTRPEVCFVPRTKVGRDIPFRDLVTEWGFSAVLLAQGAWRDRPLPIDGADAFVGRGLLYQNPFIYWFNHFQERDYAGPQYDPVDGAIVVGGGLASIDVMKALQIEVTRRTLAARGIEVEMLELEHAGIPDVLAKHGLVWDALGLRGTTLYYRRRVEDMPLAEMPDGVDDARRQKVEMTRRRILEKAAAKYCFEVRAQMVPVALLTEGDRLAGLRFQHTRVEDGRAVPIPDRFEDVRAPLVVSSIGSIPEPMDGIRDRGDFFVYSDEALGSVQGYDRVFGVGNVVTGKGNIVASRKHSVQVTQHVLGTVLATNGKAAGALVDQVTASPPLGPAAVESLLARVHERQRTVGYDCSYAEWIRRVTPPDLE